MRRCSRGEPECCRTACLLPLFEGQSSSLLVLIDETAGWPSGLDDLVARFAHRFGRAEPRRQARSYLSPLADKNGWTLAEAAGDKTPDRMQRLLNTTENCQLGVLSAYESGWPGRYA